MNVPSNEIKKSSLANLQLWTYITANVKFVYSVRNGGFPGIVCHVSLYIFLGKFNSAEFFPRKRPSLCIPIPTPPRCSPILAMQSPISQIWHPLTNSKTKAAASFPPPRLRPPSAFLYLSLFPLQSPSPP